MSRLEKDEQRDGTALLRLCGAETYTLGHARRRGDFQGTMQTPGLPDVMAFLPPAPGTISTVDRGWVFLGWEVKTPRGRVRPAQKVYAELARLSGIAHVVGPLSALRGWLITAGYLDSTGYRVLRRTT